MASGPGTFKAVTGQFDAILFFKFPREVRDNIYSFVREEPGTFEWIVAPAIEPDYYDVVGIEVLDPPCTSLLSVRQFKKEYKASLGYTVKARIRNDVLGGWYHHMAMTENQYHGDNKFIRHIFKRLKNIMIYVRMDEEDECWYEGGNCSHFTPDWNYYRVFKRMYEYSLVEELIAVIMDYSVPKEYAQYISHLPRRNSYFSGLTIPEYPLPASATSLQTITLGIPYHFNTQYQGSTCHPVVDGPHAPVMSFPTHFAGMTLVQQGQGSIVQRFRTDPKEASEQPSIAEITSDAWLECKVVTLS